MPHPIFHGTVYWLKIQGFAYLWMGVYAYGKYECCTFKKVPLYVTVDTSICK